MISATPEILHYPMARDCLLAGKHVFLEKPIAMELHEADELIAHGQQEQAQVHDRLFAALQPEVRLRQKVRSADGTHRRPVSALVSRHITRSLGKKITGRIKLSPAAMEVDARSRLRPLVPASRPSRCACIRRSTTAR